MINFRKDIVNIDLECTASEKELGSICDIGAVLIDKNTLEIKNEFSSLIRPYKIYFDPASMAVHGIPKEELMKARPLEIALDNFQLWINRDCKKQNEKHVHLSSWGSYFDMPYLIEAYKFLHRDYPFDYKCMNLKDFMRYDCALTGKPFKGGLERASRVLGLPQEWEKHRALPDAIQGALVLKALVKRRLKLISK